MEEVVEEQPRARASAVRLGIAAVLTGLMLVVGALVWFQPHKLFIDKRVSEPIPASALAAGGTASGASPPTEAAPSAAAPAPPEAVQGSFVARDHPTSGAARVLEVDGERVLRLEGFETDNGPDLYLYLSAEAATGDEDAFDDDFVSLGRLKGNQGDQNYDLSAEVDLARYGTVVIWCDRFNSAFGAADLSGG